MKRIIMISAVAATCLLASCTKTLEQSEPLPANVTYIQAYGGETSKAAIDDAVAFTWSIGDQIAVYADGYKISDALAEGGAATVTFAFSGENIVSEADRANFALFPARIASDEYEDPITDKVTATSLGVYLPGAYNLSEIAGAKSPVPMIAANAPDGKLEFKQLGALLRLKLVNVPKQTEYITFDFNGKKVQGYFTISGATPGTSYLETEDTGDEDDIITVYNDGVFSTFQTNLIVNIPVPAGTYSDITVTTWDGEPGDGGHKINSMKTPINPAVSWTAVRLSARKRIVNLPVFTLQGNTWDNAGSVKAVFAPGNLVATIASVPVVNKNIVGAVDPDSWRFADHQYDALGECNGNLLTAESDIDLFAWVGQSAADTYSASIDGESVSLAYNDATKYGVLFPSYGSLPDDIRPTNWNNYLGSVSGETIKYDWGANIISDAEGSYPAGTWRLPNIGAGGVREWQRVLTSRKLSNGSVLAYICAKATIKDGSATVAMGLVVFPDQYDPDGMPTFVHSGSDAPASHFGDNTLSLEDWAKLESVGCVFLPVTNVRDKGTLARTARYGDAAYWADYSTNATNGACMLANDRVVCTTSLDGSTVINGNKSCARQNGAAVRLVRQVN